MAESSSFKGGSASSNIQNKPTKADSAPMDEYFGKYRNAADGMSEAELFGTDQNPVENDKLPAKGLKSVGG